MPRTMLINLHKPPFDNPELRRAMVLALDRKAFVDILNDGRATSAATMLPPPDGVWGMPPEVLESLPGYGGRCRKEPRRGAPDHGEARLRTGKAASH